jgi:SRSO17 transposase
MLIEAPETSFQFQMIMTRAYEGKSSMTLVRRALDDNYLLLLAIDLNMLVNRVHLPRLGLNMLLTR